MLRKCRLCQHPLPLTLVTASGILLREVKPSLMAILHVQLSYFRDHGVVPHFSASRDE